MGDKRKVIVKVDPKTKELVKKTVKHKIKRR